jgi:hypothetical protein
MKAILEGMTAIAGARFIYIEPLIIDAYRSMLRYASDSSGQQRIARSEGLHPWAATIGSFWTRKTPVGVF